MYRFEKGGTRVYYTVGSDCGVDFTSAHFPAEGVTLTALGNTEMDTYGALKAALAGC